jgi:uncharacterized protein YecT (DUF1311 family)
MNMTKNVAMLLVAVAAIVASGGQSWADASFPCAAASSPIEKLICGNQELAGFDVAVARAFAKNRSRPDTNADRLLKEQRAWLKRRNVTCRVPAAKGDLTPQQQDEATKCLIQLYTERLRVLVPYGEDVVAYYSADDRVCQPLATALSAILRNELDATDFLDRTYNRDVVWRANEERLKRAGFTLPPPLNEGGAGSNPDPQQFTQYDLDLAHDGHRWRVVFEDNSLVGLPGTFQSYNRWFVLKPGRPFSATKKRGLPASGREDLATEPADENIVIKSDYGGEGLPEGVVVPLIPKFRKAQFQFWNQKPDDAVNEFKSSYAFARPVVYGNRVYLLSHSISPGNANDAGIGLTKFTADLKIEAVCLLASIDDFK